jgi:hypothetical protein
MFYLDMIAQIRARSSIGGQSLVADSLEPQLLKQTVECWDDNMI